MLIVGVLAIMQPPINTISDSPDPVEVPGYTNITADITGATDAYIEIYYPDGTLEGNHSMTSLGYAGWFYNSSYSYPDPLGLYNYTISAQDVGGWSTSAIYNFTVQDTTLPTSSVNALSAYWYNTDASITATANDNYEVDRVTLYYRYSSDNTSWDPWVSYGDDTISPWQWTFNFPESDGHYRFMTRARDTALNVESAPTGYDERAAYDHLPPSISNIAATPNPQTACNDVNITCESVDTGIGIDALYVEIIYPDHSTANFSMHYNPCTIYYMLSCYSQVGTYDYTIYAVDKLGNGVTSSVRHFTIISCGDTTPPETTAILNPASPDGGGGWYISPVTITLSATDDDTGVDYTKYRIDNGSWFTYSGTFIVSNNGHHQVDFYSVDNTGNTETTDHVTFKVNISSPMTSYTLNPASPTGENGWYLSSVTVLLFATDPDGIDQTYYRINGGVWIIYATSINLTTDGVHVVEFYSIDSLSNSESVKSVIVKIDGTNPTISIIRPRFSYLYLFDREIFPTVSGLTLSIGRLTVNTAATDLTSGILNVTFYTNDIAQSIDLQSPYQWIWGGDVGSKALYAVAHDEAGNMAVSTSIMVTIISI